MEPARGYDALESQDVRSSPPQQRVPVKAEEPCFDLGCICTFFLMALVMAVTGFGVYTYMQGWGWWDDYLYGFRSNDLVHAVTDLNDYHLSIDATELVVALIHGTYCEFAQGIIPALEDMAVRHKGLTNFITLDLQSVDLSLSDYRYVPRSLPSFVLLCHGQNLGEIPAKNFQELETAILEAERYCEAQKLQLPGVFGGRG